MDALETSSAVTLVFLRKQDALAKKRMKALRAIAWMSVMAKWHASVLVLLLAHNSEPEQGK